nr:unnamed protein product [Callosobruchus analis]
MDRKRLRALHEIAGHLSQSTGFGVVHLYSPKAVAEVHTDASVLGLGVTAREQAARKIEAAQLGQKRDFERYGRLRGLIGQAT